MTPNGYRATTIYDARGRVVASVDAINNWISYSYDSNGNQIAEQNARGIFTTFVYDALDRQIAVVDGKGNATTTLYDARGLAKATVDALGNITTAVYDAVGNQTGRIDALGATTAYSYDQLDRRTEMLYPNGQRVTYSFDAASQRTGLIDSVGSTTYGYDRVGRLLSVAYPVTGNLTYSYDTIGNRLTMQDTDNGLTTYSYDANNQLTSLLNPFNELTTYGYDPVGNLKQQNYANGMSATFTYDNDNRPLRRYHSTGATVLLGQDMGYTNSGYQRYVIDNGTVPVNINTAYEYDPSYQLTREYRSGYAVSYTYDATGNRIQQRLNSVVTNYTVNALNQVTLEQSGTNVTTHLYDANGNRVASNLNGSLTNFNWDNENRLIAIVYPAGNRDTFIYDGDGQRREKQFSGGSNKFVYDGANLLQTLDASNATISQYTDYPGQWGGLTSQRKGGVSSFFGTDIQSHTRFLTDASGTVTDSYWTNRFGDPIYTTGGSANPFIFGGAYGYYKESNDRYFVRARYYDALQGKWLSKDPFGFDGGDWNLYRYVGNNPIDGIDPSGNASTGLAVRLGDLVSKGIDIADTGIHFFYSQDNIPFMRHYWYGNGQPVDLTDWGLADEYFNSIDVIKFKNQFEKKIFNTAQRIAKMRAKKGAKNDWETFTASGRDITNSTCEDKLFALGHSIIMGRFSGSITIDYKNRKFSYAGATHYYVRDRFTWPLYTNGYGIKGDLYGSTPYDINGDQWNASDGNGRF